MTPGQKKRIERVRQRRKVNAPLKHSNYKFSGKPAKHMSTQHPQEQSAEQSIKRNAQYYGSKPKAWDDVPVEAKDSTGRVIYKGTVGKLRKQVAAEKQIKKRNKKRKYG